MRVSSTQESQPSANQVQHFRLNLLITLLVLLSFVLIFRLAYLQIAEYKKFQTLSLKNKLSINPIEPTRGIIVDRNGVMLAENVPVYVLEVIPERVKNLKQTIEQLQELIPSIRHEDVENFYKARRQKRAFTAIPLKIQLSQEEIALLAVNQYRFPGVSIKARLMRHYPLGESMAHIIGYVGRINAKELQNLDTANYRATNFIGKTGLEKYYEDILHGRVGYQEVETDVSGRILRTVNQQNPRSGTKLTLSIDARIQQAAYEAMKGKSGSVVVLDTNNADILAMISSPSFNPNLFINGIRSKDYQALITAKDKPLYNRAVHGTYAPASTIKPFIALAGLDKKIITPSTSIYDPGYFKFPHASHIYRDWKKRGHGMVSLKRAITTSCDTYFYRLGDSLGISNIEDMLTQFGFGQLTHVDLQGESAGVVPSESWKKKNTGKIWYPGDTLISAIGQGFMLSTPLQLANATAALGMKGRRFRPHFLNQVTDMDTNETRKLNPLEEYPANVSKSEYWDIIAETMKNVIQSREGTGFRFGRNSPYSVAAKTGTAQVYSGKLYERVSYEEIPIHLRDNSLFIAFAPIEHPKVAIAVIIENDFVAPNIARKVLDAYFNPPELEKKA